MMSAAAGAAKQLDQVKALAENALVGVEAMVGDDYQRGFAGKRALLNRRPDAAYESVKLLEREQVRIPIVVVMGAVIEFHRQQIQVTHARIGKLFNQLTFQFIVNDVAHIKSDQHVDGQSFGILNKTLFARALQGTEPRAALVKLKAGQTFVIVIGVHQWMNAQAIQYFSAGHVDVSPHCLLNIERQRREIVIRVESCAIEFNVAFDLQMLSRVDEGPGRRGETHASDIKVGDGRAHLEKDVNETWKEATPAKRLAFRAET